MKNRLLAAGVVLLVGTLLTGAAGGAPGGALDAAFGDHGRVVLDLGGNDYLWDVAVQPDGKIVAVGETDARFVVARFARNGALDPSFSGGYVTTRVGGSRSGAYAVALQADGKLLVAGGSAGPGSDFALARYNRDGSLDTGFGGGTVVTDFGQWEWITHLALARNGKIVAAGDISPPAPPGTPQSVNHIALARYDADGNLDPSFGVGGKVVTNLGGNDESPGGLALRPDGEILVSAGTQRDGSSASALVRYRTDGTLDESFGAGGRVVAPCPPCFGGALLQRDGKIVVTTNADGGLALARYTSDGEVDSGFASDAAGMVSANDLALQANGKIVALGWTWTTQADFAVARFLPDGKVDPHFGNRGTVVVDRPSQDFGFAGGVVQPDGRLVGAGVTRTSDTAELDFALTRFLPGTCSVPNLRGAALATARGRLAAGNCRLGRIGRAFSRRVRKDRVISQSLAPRSEAKDWAAIGVVLSRGHK